MSIDQQPVRRSMRADQWEGYQTADEVVVYYNDQVGGRQTVLRARWDEVAAVAVAREAPWQLCLLGLPLVLAFLASLAVGLGGELTATQWLLYIASPLFFLGALAYVGYLYFAPPLLRVSLRGRPPVTLPAGLREVFDG